MRFYETTASLIIVVLLATWEINATQVTVGTSPLAVGGSTNLEARLVGSRTTPTGDMNVNLPVTGLGATTERNSEKASVRQEKRVEGEAKRQGDRSAAVDNNWRMRKYNNQWWYWNTNNTWSVYRNNHWVPYTAGKTPALGAGEVISQPAQQYNYSRQGRPGVGRRVTGYRGPVMAAPSTNSTAVTGATTTQAEAPHLNAPAAPSLPVNRTVPSTALPPAVNQSAGDPEGGTNGQPNDPFIR